MKAKPRPTDAEFDELKRKRNEALDAMVAAVAQKWEKDPSELHVHDSGTSLCYCACTDGPCQHIWNGPEYTEENMSSVTCSLCGTPAIYHDIRVGE